MFNRVIHKYKCKIYGGRLHRKNKDIELYIF